MDGMDGNVEGIGLMCRDFDKTHGGEQGGADSLVGS
jgi:hypothetical protein